MEYPIAKATKKKAAKPAASAWDVQKIEERVGPLIWKIIWTKYHSVIYDHNSCSTSSLWKINDPETIWCQNENKHVE